MRETPRRGAAVSLLLGILVVGALGLAPTASGYVYWANASTIGRAENDGSAANPNFTTGQKGPCGLAVDSQHIYWANQVGSSIGRAYLDGSNPHVMYDNPIIEGPRGIGVGAGQPWAAAGSISQPSTGS